MQKTSLKLYEFYSLEAELNGVINPQTGEVTSKGLISEKIKMATKYWLNDLSKKVVTEKEACEELKKELIFLLLHQIILRLKLLKFLGEVCQNL